MIEISTQVKEVLGNDIIAIFEFMEEAELVIDEMKKRYPLYTQLIHDSFHALTPDHSLIIKHNKELYRHHCREIIERIVKGESLKAATKAEICVALCDMSLIASLNNDATLLYVRLMEEIFGQKFDGKCPVYESYKGAADELYIQFRRKLKDERRDRDENDM